MNRFQFCVPTFRVHGVKSFFTDQLGSSPTVNTEVNLELSRPWKVNLSLVKLDQATKFFKSVLPRYGSEITSKAAVSPETVYSKEEMLTSASGVRIEPGSFTERTMDQGNIWKMMSFFQKFSIHTAQVVVAMEAVPHPDKPCILASLSSLKGILNIKAGPKSTGMILGATFALQLKDLLVKTCLKDRTRALIGPFCCTLQLDAKWCRHSGDPDPHHSVPKMLVDLKAGLIQIFWGQEHLNCLNLLHELLQGYLGQDAKSQTSDHTQQSSSAIGRYQAFKTEHSSDDLRTGQFQYIQDADVQKLPSIFEVVFYNETDDRPGMMMWRYPEPRVLTLVRINPVPFNTTEDPDISTADLGDVLQVPCSLQYWDELQQVFVDYREFSLSESKACELQLPNVTLTSDQKELIASDLWRIVLNSNQEVTEELSSDGESGSQSVCDQLVSPMALAACTRVDSCFAAWFVPSFGISLQFAQIELHLCHHLDQLGRAHPSCLQAFIPDRKLPAEQEYMIVSLKSPNVYMWQWSDGPVYRELQFSAIANCKLLEYRNLTMTSILKPFIFHGQVVISNSCVEQLMDGNVFVDPVFISVGQHAVHSLDIAARAWRQNEHPEAEELVFSHFVICNDTQETLRFGQVDTDENVLLASQHSHQYSWRSHKSPQLLHICIEGWGNWRWSEPFSVDNIGTFVRSIQYKGRTASLIIKVQPLNSVQKQIIICGRQAICSYLNLDVELKVVQHCSGQDGRESIKEHLCCLPLNQKIPSFVLENTEFTELCIRVMGNDTDWSPDVRLETLQSEDSTVIQVPNSNGSMLHVWCTCLNLDVKSPVQQRVLFLSPLFVMRSHLPDPIILHVERRSLGLKDPQVIAGKGQEDPLQNVEPEVVHHLTFQAREEDEASQCAVPISTVLIKQIVRGPQSDCTVAKLLREFYNMDTDARNPWPYITKEPDSKNSSELLAQWDSPMQVKLSAWKPCLNTLLVELLPWALFVNESKWDLWLFEGEKIVVQVPAGKVIVPPNFQEPFQIGIYWASTNTVHKSTAVRLVHDVTSPKWKDYPVTDVITLDEDGIADADVKLGTFPDHQKLCQFCISSVVRHGIQILLIEDKTVITNATAHKIYYRPMLVFPERTTRKEVHVVESSVFSLSPARAHSPAMPSSIPCWDLLAGGSQADFTAPLPQKYLLLGYSPHVGINSCHDWSLPTIIRQDFPRQSVAVPLGDSGESGFCSSIRRHQERRAILTPVLTDFSVRITAAPAILFTKQVSPENTQTEEIIVCGHSLEVNVTTSLDFFLSVAQVQLLQELIQVNMHELELVDPTTENCQKEQNKTTPAEGSPMDTLSRHSGAQDSGIGSDSARIRIVQIEQQSGTSHHRLARPSRQSSIVKNLNFIPFDIFVTASRISLMTYSAADSSKSRSQQESQSQKVSDKLGRSTLNRKSMEIDGVPENKSGQPGIAVLTAEDLLNSNPPLSIGKVTSHLSLESLHTPSRSSARQALGVTVVRQPGRRGTNDLQLEPFVYLVIAQPSLLVSCHHRKQMVDLSFFDATLKAVPPDYKCLDPGKTLPEALDYSVFWLQTVAGDVDLKAGIPPPLISFQIKDFLNGPGLLKGMLH
ncbi:intermembrane lipid transfer protein VPS13B-like [Rhincodon typus]|uniref:intermembrane lipid transfer protein VPS13B-like n=1 Tax=Rhincodon typus TaxID=259920 RepID=UPI00203030C6|nr:intermembrane lipid transfer protein VPS13B-like [Rhincodon typus]